MRSSFLTGTLTVGLLTLGPAHAVLGQELTLTDALRGAMESHPALGAARAAVLGSDADVVAARARRLPSVGTSAGLTRFQEPMLVAPLHAFDPANIPDFDLTLMRAQLALQYTVFEGGRASAGLRGAEAKAETARWSARTTEVELIQAVTDAYLAVLSTEEIQEAAARQVAALLAEEERAERHLAEGAAPEVEVLRAAAAGLEAQAEVATAAARASAARKTLGRLMGLSSGALADRSLLSVRVRSRDDQEASAGTRPEVERSRSAVLSTAARVDQARASRLPRIDANAGLLDFGTLGGGHIAEWQAGVTGSWSLFTGGARSASIRRAEADHQAAENRLRLTELQVNNAADVAQAALVESTTRAAALEAAVAQWEEVARIEALRLNEGAGQQTDLLRAQAGLFRARAGHAQARYAEVSARVQLARARGLLDREWMETAMETIR